MSDLKHLDLPQLLSARRYCEKTINYHAGRVSGQKERLKWIDKYIAAKTLNLVENERYEHDQMASRNF